MIATCMARNGPTFWPNMSFRALWLGRARTLFIASLGALAFIFLQLPLPLLLGPMIACLVAALSGVSLTSMGELGVYLRTFLGVAVGASLTPEIVGKLPLMLGSLAFVPVFVLVIGAVGYPLFRHVFGLSHPTAYYAAMPGGLQDMLVFGEEAGGDVRALSLIHATRVLAIVTIAPFIMSHFWEVDLTRPAGLPAREMEVVQIILMMIAGGVGWKIAERVGLFGASILGPMILTAALTLSGVITHRPPAEMIWAAQLFIGIAVGAKYAGITLREIKLFVAAGLAYAAGLALISLLFIEAVTALDFAPALSATLAFLPGGQAEMVIIAILAGADLAYVVSHHLLRLVLVILLAPVVARVVRALGSRR
jgi:uncharacterized protein